MTLTKLIMALPQIVRAGIQFTSPEAEVDPGARLRAATPPTGDSGPLRSRDLMQGLVVSDTINCGHYARHLVVSNLNPVFSC